MFRRWSALIIVVCCCLTLVVPAYAQTYTIGDTDLTLNIDDTYWYVFTRDNIKNNPELIDFGVSYDYMYDFFMNNQAYVDAILFYEDDSYIELFVRKKSIDDVINLSEHDDSEVRVLAKKLADKQGASNYSIYTTHYKFVRLEYIDQGFYLCEYYTVVNGENYTFTFQSLEPFSASQYSDIEEVVDGIRFHIDTSLSKNKSSSLAEDLLEAFIRGALVAAILGGGGILVKIIANKKPKHQNETETYVSTSNISHISDSNKVPTTYGSTDGNENGRSLHVDEKTENVAEIASTNAKNYFCRKCGSKLLEDALFCTMCGTKVIIDVQREE